MQRPENTSVIEEAWSENGKEVGSHGDMDDLKTIDQLYDICEKEVLSRIPNCNNFHIEISPDNLINECVHYKCGWACDHPGDGVFMGSIEYTNKPKTTGKKNESYYYEGKDVDNFKEIPECKEEYEKDNNKVPY